MATGLCLISILALICAFGKPGRAGKIRLPDNSNPEQPVAIIGDGNSIRLKIFPSQKKMFSSCKQTIAIDYKQDQTFVQLDTAKIPCKDVKKLYKALSPGFINLGDAIYVQANSGEPIKTLFVVTKRECVLRTYTDENRNKLQKPLEKPLITKRDCDDAKKSMQPKSKLLSKVKADTLLVINPTPAKGSEVTLPVSLQAPTTPLNMAGAQTPKKNPAAFTSKPPTSKTGVGEWPQVDDGLMQLVSADGIVGKSFSTNKGERVTRYTSGSLYITIENLYKDKFKECVRLVVIYYGQVEMDRVTVSCGQVRGLTMTNNFIKYRRAFVVNVASPTTITALFNTKVGDCIKRTYYLEGVNSQSNIVRKENERTKDANCMDLKNGNVKGVLFGTAYDDTHMGLLNNVVTEFIPFSGPGESTLQVELTPQNTAGNKASPSNVNNSPPQSSAIIDSIVQLSTPSSTTDSKDSSTAQNPPLSKPSRKAF